MSNIQAIERTKEFSSIIQRLITRSQIIGKNNSFKNKSVKTKNKFPIIDIFIKQAKKLTNLISDTESKVCQLCVLIEMNLKRGDNSKISLLTEVIRSDLSDMSKEFSILQELLGKASEVLGTSVQTRGHISGICINIQKRFQKLIKDFKYNLKFSESPISSATNITIDNGKFESNSKISVTYPTQISLQMQDNEIRQREKSVRDVEATIVQLGDVFEQFSTVVQEQEELVFNISKNATATFLDIDEAHNQLTKYFQTVKNHRGLMIKLFIVLVILTVVFMYFL